MIRHVIHLSSANRPLVFIGALGIATWGLWAMSRVALDAVPDLSDLQVTISTEWPGQSPDLIERQVTAPVVSSFAAVPRIKSVRGVNEFGVAHVYAIFQDGTDPNWARQRVHEAIEAVRGKLPPGVSPTIGPDASGAGWVFEYALVDDSSRLSLADLREFHDWHLRPWLSSVPGVAEVATIGGFTKQYEVNVNPLKLAFRGLGLNDVVNALRAGNRDVDAMALEVAGRESVVRARGSLGSLSDLEQLSIATDPDRPSVRIVDVAEVRVGPEARRGVAELDGLGEVTAGIVIMRSGENALKVIDAVKAKLREVEPSFPPHVRVVPTYDRSLLVRDSVKTLLRTLLEETVVVSLVIVIFLRSVRAALVSVLMIPLAVLASFIPMYYLGVSANIMSLCGLALAIGVIADASIIFVENACRSVSDNTHAVVMNQHAAVIASSVQIARAVLFSLAIIIVSFVPVFMLEAEEGRLFRPLAFTKTFAVVTASLLSISLGPALMTRLISGRPVVPETSNPVSTFFRRLYLPIIRAALHWKRTTLMINASVVVPAVVLFVNLGSEFMPPLHEGTLLYMPTTAPGLTVTAASQVLQAQDLILAGFPEVERVFGSVGRATTATDNGSMSMMNTIVALKPRAHWRRGVTLEGLQQEMDEQLRFPGFSNVWTQPIRGRLDMVATGIKTPLGIKVLGSDFESLQNIGHQIERVLNQMPETRSVFAERAADGHFTDIQMNRDAIARFGLSVSDVEDVVESAIGGETVTATIEGRVRRPVNVRYMRAFRDSVSDFNDVLVRNPSGVQVPLGQLATITSTVGPAMIRNENGQLASYVYVDTSTRDLDRYVARAKRAVAAQVALPAGYQLQWTGQYELKQRADERLAVIVPIVIAVAFLLLYQLFHSAAEAATVLLSVVYAMSGGVVLQWALGYNFSVAVWVGYIALYGVALQTGIVMVMYLHEALDRRRREKGGVLDEHDVMEAAIAGSVLRLRPKLMTAFVVMLSLLPILWSSGAGADLMKPIAAPIIGGMVTSTVHVLIVTPVIFVLLKTRVLQKRPLHVSS